MWGLASSSPPLSLLSIFLNDERFIAIYCGFDLENIFGGSEKLIQINKLQIRESMEEFQESTPIFYKYLLKGGGKVSWVTNYIYLVTIGSCMTMECNNGGDSSSWGPTPPGAHPTQSHHCTPVQGWNRLVGSSPIAKKSLLRSSRGEWKINHNWWHDMAWPEDHWPALWVVWWCPVCQQSYIW